MRIGIIGSEISGLAAGRLLANAGHEVVIIEKNRTYGGKMVSRCAENGLRSTFDYGISCFSAETPEFSSFIAELISRDLVKIWGDTYSFYDGVELLSDNPNRYRKTRYAALGGMSTISRYLGRQADFLYGEKAGGITRIATGRGKKRPWMINLTNFNTLEVDAVIISTPAPEAYGIVLTAQDEPAMLTAIREIDAIDYEPSCTLMAGYKTSTECEWDAIISQDDVISFISNESSKRPVKGETALVAHSTAEFSRSLQDSSEDGILNQMLERLAAITGKWAKSPDWTDLHFWRFNKPKSHLARPYVSIGEMDAPLALIGDYFGDSSPEAAYCSGVKLARQWIDDFKRIPVSEQMPRTSV